MFARRALELAEQKQLDLVKIAPQATPPVCKIMDYGKFKFEAAKKEKESRKNQHIIDIKEVRLSISIEDYDLGVKAKSADKFLKSGDKVKVSIKFRGREKAHCNVGYDVMEKFLSMLSSEYLLERKPKLEGWNMIMILTPKEDRSKEG